MSETDADVVVVGGGIVGLAAARALLDTRPRIGVVVVEKETAVAAHQSSHNSGVLHAGVYYPPGSEKARLVRRGKALLEEYAAARGVPVARTGKLVVAVDPGELPRIAALEERARANGVPGIARVDAAGIRRIEPAARGIAALHSPTTAVTDFGAVARALAADVRSSGGEVATGEEVVGLTERPRSILVRTRRRTLRAGAVLAAGGLHADRIAALTIPRPPVRTVPFRGTYRSLVGEAAEWVRGNVYPLADPALPFLGPHFTRHVDGTTSLGPTAFLAFAREGYRRSRVVPGDVVDALAFPGLRRFLLAHPRTVLTEALREVSAAAVLASARRYVPDLDRTHLGTLSTGVRAQAMRPDGTLVEDFAVVGSGRTVHVLNAPSPAATASLAIGEELAGRVLAVLDGAGSLGS